jgi:hypothetical protein
MAGPTIRENPPRLRNRRAVLKYHISDATNMLDRKPGSHRMSVPRWVHDAVDHLKVHRVYFEPGLSDEEVARVERDCGIRFPRDLRLFLQTALPVTGGFPNWRSESVNNLRHSFLDGPSRGVLFDVEHNGFWATGWGSRPRGLDNVVSAATRHLSEAPVLIPVRSQDYLPGEPSTEGNPVFFVRQTEVRCVGRDLRSYLLDLFEPASPINLAVTRAIAFWTDVARTSTMHVPNLAGKMADDQERDYADLCRAITRAGFWAEIEMLPTGEKRVGFDRTRPEGERRWGRFWLEKREFGWLLGLLGPRYYFVCDPLCLPDFCVALLSEQPYRQVATARESFWKIRLDDEIHSAFGLVAIHPYSHMDDVREKILRSLEQIGWRAMSRGQTDQEWDRYVQAFGCPAGGNGLTTPAPSVTWDIAPIYLRTGEYLRQMEADLTLKALDALKKCTRPGEELLVLDWQHTCYFFNPHGGVMDANPSAWAKPVLPNGDHYIFLAQDYRFGIIGNCCDVTMCVFGQDLLAAFQESMPSIFNRTTWSFEQRRDMERCWADHGWKRLTTEEKDEVWEQFDSKFEFYQRRLNLQFPTIRGPAPSRTWDVVSAPAPQEADVAELTLKILTALQRATRPGERLYALDFPHWYEHYTFDPHTLTSASRDCWALPVYSDDIFTIFLAPDFRFGVVGNPVERTLCIYGEDLLAALGNDLPRMLGNMVRKDGTPVAFTEMNT